VLPAIVLAAGAATRFGAPKQQLLLPDVLERLRAAESVGEIVVVSGAYEVETDARIVPCADWERGMGASLRCGLQGLDGEAAIVVLADGPTLSPQAVDRVVEVWAESAAELVAATYGGNRGHPVVIARALWTEIPDEGARSLPALLVPCDDLGLPGDVDQPGDDLRT
jgi:CTP:molybdopterin cytidylyltransferase MocA